jgi:hypothetical protein
MMDSPRITESDLPASLSTLSDRAPLLYEELADALRATRGEGRLDTVVGKLLTDDEPAARLVGVNLCAPHLSFVSPEIRQSAANLFSDPAPEVATAARGLAARIGDPSVELRDVVVQSAFSESTALAALSNFELGELPIGNGIAWRVYNVHLRSSDSALLLSALLGVSGAARSGQEVPDTIRDSVMALLRDGRPAVRRAAIEASSHFKPVLSSDLPMILSSLTSDPDNRVRRAALLSLAYHAPPMDRVLSILQKAMEGDADMKYRVVLVLGEYRVIPPELLPGVRSLLDPAQPTRHRCAAAWTLSRSAYEIHDPREAALHGEWLGTIMERESDVETRRYLQTAIESRKRLAVSGLEQVARL